MYEVFLWIPAKGWNGVGQYATLAEARRRRDTFLPLETKVLGPGEMAECAGFFHEQVEFVDGNGRRFFRRTAIGRVA